MRLGGTFQENIFLRLFIVRFFTGYDKGKEFQKTKSGQFPELNMRGHICPYAEDQAFIPKFTESFFYIREHCSVCDQGIPVSVVHVKGVRVERKPFFLEDPLETDQPVVDGGSLADLILELGVFRLQSGRGLLFAPTEMGVRILIQRFHCGSMSVVVII